jgi:hypothetical protein
VEAILLGYGGVSYAMLVGRSRSALPLGALASFRDRKAKAIEEVAGGGRSTS